MVPCHDTFATKRSDERNERQFARFACEYSYCFWRAAAH
jgi:hypothetical protein